MSGIWPYIVVPLVIGILTLIVWFSFTSERAFRPELRLRDPMDDLTFYESFYASTERTRRHSATLTSNLWDVLRHRRNKTAPYGPATGNHRH